MKRRSIAWIAALAFVMLVLTLLAHCTPPVVQDAKFRIELPSREVLLSARDIESYDWAAHTMTLKPGVVEMLRNRLEGSLVAGVPFVVKAEGRECCRGLFTTSFSSQSQQGPCIVFDLTTRDPAKRDTELSIQMHYPWSRVPTASDPPADGRVRDALRALGKLKE
jgi:hypothetical protein